MIIQLKSLETGNIYNVTVPEITEAMTAQTGEVITNLATAETTEMNLWKWYNEAMETGLFVGTPDLLSLKTTRGYPFHPPFPSNELPGISGTDLVEIMKADYRASGRSYRGGYTPAGIATLGTRNQCVFDVVMGDKYTGDGITVIIGLGMLDGADKYDTQEHPVTYYYDASAADDSSVVSSVIAILGIRSRIWDSVRTISTISRHGSDNTLDDRYKPGVSGLAKFGFPKFYFIYNPYQKYDSNVTGRPDSVIPTLCLATPNIAQDDGITETNPLLYRGPSISVMTLSDAADDAIRANEPEPTDPRGLPNLEQYIGANDSGLVTVYSVSPEVMRQFGKWLWTGDIVIVIKKIFSDVEDSIVSAHILPLSSTEMGDGNAVPIYVGNINTQLAATKAKSVVIKDMGTIDISQHFNSYLDYQTDLTLYIPYVGYQPLDIQRYMTKTLGLTYYIDTLTGTAIAFLTSDGKVIQQYECNLARTIPISSLSYTDAIRNILQAVSSTAGGVMAATSGNAFSATGAFSSAIGSGLAAAGNNAYGSIRQINGVTAAPAQLSVQYPTLIIERPIIATPDGYSAYVGGPGVGESDLSTLTGYAEVIRPQINVNAESEDYDEIVTLLQGGVIF